MRDNGRQKKNHVCLPRRSRDRGLWIRSRDRNLLLSVPLWGPVWNIKGRSLTVKKTQSCMVLVVVLRRPDERHTLTMVLSMHAHTDINAMHLRTRATHVSTRLRDCVYLVIDILCPNSHFTEWPRRWWRDSNMSQLLTNSPGNLWSGKCTMTHSRNTVYQCCWYAETSQTLYSTCQFAWCGVPTNLPPVPLPCRMTSALQEKMTAKQFPLPLTETAFCCHFYRIWNLKLMNECMPIIYSCILVQHKKSFGKLTEEVQGAI